MAAARCTAGSRSCRETRTGAICCCSTSTSTVTTGPGSVRVTRPGGPGPWRCCRCSSGATPSSGWPEGADRGRRPSRSPRPRAGGPPQAAGRRHGHAMTGWPAQPVIYEINTAVWLTGLSRAAGRRLTLADVSDSDWDAVDPGPRGCRLADGCLGTEPGRASLGERERRAAGVVPGGPARPGARRRHRVAVLRAALRRRRGLRRAGGARHGAGRPGRPRCQAAPGLRAQPCRPRPPVGDSQPGALRARRRTRPAG